MADCRANFRRSEKTKRMIDLSCYQILGFDTIPNQTRTQIRRLEQHLVQFQTVPFQIFEKESLFAFYEPFNMD